MYVFLAALLAVAHLHHHMVRDELGQGRVPRQIQKLSKTSSDQHGTMTHLKYINTARANEQTFQAIQDI